MPRGSHSSRRRSRVPLDSPGSPMGGTLAPTCAASCPRLTGAGRGRVREEFIAMPVLRRSAPPVGRHAAAAKPCPCRPRGRRRAQRGNTGTARPDRWDGARECARWRRCDRQPVGVELAFGRRRVHLGAGTEGLRCRAGGAAAGLDPSRPGRPPVVGGPSAGRLRPQQSYGYPPAVAMVSACRNAGVRVFVDAVINHTAGTDRASTDSCGGKAGATTRPRRGRRGAARSATPGQAAPLSRSA